MFSDYPTASQNLATSALLAASISFYAAHVAHLPVKITSKFSKFQHFRLCHLGNLCDFTSLVYKKRARIQEVDLKELGITFEYMSLYADILSERSDLNDGMFSYILDNSATDKVVVSHLSGIARSMETETSQKSERIAVGSGHVYVLLLRLDTILGTMKGDIHSIPRAISSCKKREISFHTYGVS